MLSTVTENSRDEIDVQIGKYAYGWSALAGEGQETLWVEEMRVLAPDIFLPTQYIISRFALHALQHRKDMPVVHRHRQGQPRTLRDRDLVDDLAGQRSDRLR